MEEKRYGGGVPRSHRTCVLVVGAGAVALEKVQGLLDAGATVTVVAPQVVAELEALPVEIVRCTYRPTDLDNRFLVVVATSTPSVNRRVYRRRPNARSSATSSTPELYSFILPAVHRQDPIAVAISTGGASPALAQRLRDEVAAVIDPSTRLSHDSCATCAPGRSTLPHLRGPPGPLPGAGRGGTVVTVHLVGAGPGDPGLITVRGLDLLRHCDALVHDVLVADELVAGGPTTH